MVDAVGVTRDSDVVGVTQEQDNVDYKPRLAGAGPETIVTVHNPLPNDFSFKHARTVTQAPQLDKDRMFAQERAGLDMRKDQNPIAHYTQYWVLKAGESKRLPGDIAQKAVQDLTNYILLMRAGKGNPKLVADGFARKQVEEDIILNVQDSVALMNSVDPIDKNVAEVEALNTAETASEPDNPPPGQGVSYVPDRESSKASQQTK